eukprot:8775156-Pyramimonas_sp.AAC.1
MRGGGTVGIYSANSAVSSPGAMDAEQEVLNMIQRRESLLGEVKVRPLPKRPPQPIMRIYLRVPRPIGPSSEYSCAAFIRLVHRQNIPARRSSDWSIMRMCLCVLRPMGPRCATPRWYRYRYSPAPA